VLAQSRDRIFKERSMRQRQLKRLWKRLHQLRDRELSRDQLLLKLGAARQQSPSAWRFVEIAIPKTNEPFQFSLHKDRLRKARRREGAIPPSNQPDWPRPCRNVGVLYPVGPCRRSIQKPVYPAGARTANPAYPVTALSPRSASTPHGGQYRHGLSKM
jgi:hypothetical protein